MPLYSGGAVSAGVTQALADQTRAEAELAAEQQTVVRDVTRLYHMASLGGDKLAALQTSIDAATLNLEAAQKSLTAGLATQLDIAQARRKLAVAAQEQVQGLHDLLLGRLRLHLRTGEEPAAAVQRLEEALAASP